MTRTTRHKGQPRPLPIEEMDITDVMEGKV